MNRPPPLDLQLRVSRMAIGFIAFTHAATAALLMALPWPLVFRVIGTGVVVAAGTLALRNAVRDAPASLRVDIDRRMTVVTRHGRRCEGEVLEGSYAGARITTIVWRPGKAWFARALLVLPDALPEDDFRRLRVVLRYSRVPARLAGRSGEDAG